MRHLPTLLLLLACGDGVPEPCPQMCAAAMPLQERCLADEGLDWTATTWESAEGFLASCETWAWEHRRLERDARRRGELVGGGHTAELCEARLATFEDPDADCASWEGIDWDRPPWEAR